MLIFCPICVEENLDTKTKKIKCKNYLKISLFKYLFKIRLPLKVKRVKNVREKKSNTNYYFFGSCVSLGQRTSRIVHLNVKLLKFNYLKSMFNIQ